MADKKLSDGLQLVKNISLAPQHRRTDLSNEAWEGLRAGIVACKKDDGPLNAVAKADAVLALEFLCGHAKTKKMLKGRINECIKIVLATDAWILAARNGTEELKTNLKETLGDSGGDLVAKLETPSAPERGVEGAAETGEEESVAEQPTEKEPAVVMLENGRDGMREFGFEFPHDPLGTMLDRATEAFMLVYEALSKLDIGRRFETLIADGVNPFESIEENFADMLKFLVSMAEARSRGSYISRVKYVIEKLQNLSPQFKEEVVKRGKPMPWEAVTDVSPTEEVPAEEILVAETPAEETPAEETPVEEAAAEETPVDETLAEDALAEDKITDELPTEVAAEEAPVEIIEKPRALRETRPGVVWIDFKSESFTLSILNRMEGIEFRGFHDDESAKTYESSEVWMKYIGDRAGDPYERVAVVILNFKYLGAVGEIIAKCRSMGWEVPEFVMVTRRRSEELTAGGIKPNMITGDWVEAAKLAMGFLQTRYALKPVP
eukprot:TRINITY_DN32476_c0_g1_i1.p1 TRINITY_DN32476_c0_g1~~TRINITY_DN32476_c0_g1_i1.p1  ORF type:complete len:527 (+),score=125.10 TRINITY_DN32476_c0_g1_i1:104-1582(+)